MTTASASTGAPGTTGASTDSPGLTTTDVLLRLERDGANALPEPARESPWAMFARQLTHLLALLLWVGAGLALLAGMPELSAAIVVIVLLNALFGHQERAGQHRRPTPDRRPRWDRRLHSMLFGARRPGGLVPRGLCRRSRRR